MAVALREFFFPIEKPIPERKPSPYPEPRRPFGVRPPATEAEAAAAAVKVIFGPLNWVDEQYAIDRRAKPWKQVSFGGRLGQDPSGEDYALDLRGGWRQFLTHPVKTTKSAAKKLLIRKAYDAVQSSALRHYHDLWQAGRISQQDYTKFVGRVDKALEWVGPRDWKKIQTPQGVRRISTSLTKGSGKLWERLEFIDNPIGYTMREYAWKKGVRPAISKATRPVTEPARKVVSRAATPIKSGAKRVAQATPKAAKTAAKKIGQAVAPIVKKALVAAGHALVVAGTKVVAFVGSVVSSIAAAASSALSAPAVAVIVVVVIILLLILALFVVIGTKSAFLPPEMGGGLEEQLVQITKRAAPSNIPADGNSYSVTYTITVTNNSDEDAEVALRDETYARDFSATVPAEVANQTIGSFTVSVPTQVGVDEVIINTVTGTAVLESETISLGASGILIVGDPSGQPPSGWPTAKGCVTQGPGGSYSHAGDEAIDVGKLTGDISAHTVYATHDGIAYVWTGPDGPLPSAYGKYVEVVSHGGTFRTYYAHLFSHSITSEMAVERGTELGVMGKTGSTDGGVHVHYEFRGTYEGSSLKMEPPYIPSVIGPCAERGPCNCCFSGFDGACGSGP